MNPNPLSDRERALEDQWIKEKEKQMAKDRVAKNQAAKDNSAGVKAQEPAGQEKK